MKFNIFQKIMSGFTIAGMLLLFSGCPYQSSVPIDQGTVKVPDYLKGEWISTSDTENENPTCYKIDEAGKYAATAYKLEFSSENQAYDTTVYRLTFSDVDGDVFMNAIEDGGSSYYLYRMKYNESEGSVNTEEVTDYIRESFENSADLKKFISENKHLSFFFTSTPSDYVRK